MPLWGRLRDWFSARIMREPPSQPVFWTLESVHLARAYYVAAQLGIADLLRQRPMSATELASRTGTHERSLYRILRALAAFGVFAENRDGEFEMTRRAEPLRSDVHGSVREWTAFVGCAENWQAFGMALETVRQGRNGFELAHGNTWYEYGIENEDFGNAFSNGMNSWTKWQCYAIVNAYEFRRFSKVVDVGGGQGRLLMEILLRNPHIKGTLYDRVAAIEHARRGISAAGLIDRCELIWGNFLENVPAGGDLYLLKHVLRDWDDGNARKILEHCSQAMPLSGTVLIIDGIIDPRNNTDRLQKLIDLEQMFWLSGAMRTWQEWAALLQESGFVPGKPRRTDIGDVTLIEATKSR